MSKFATTLLATLLVFTLTGCGDSPEKLMDDMASTLDEMTATLEKVKDVDSAKANADKIADLAKEMQGFETRANEMEKPSEEKIKELKEKYKERFKESSKNLFKELMRISQLDKEVQEVLDEAFDKVKGESSGMPDWFK